MIGSNQTGLMNRLDGEAAATSCLKRTRSARAAADDGDERTVGHVVGTRVVGGVGRVRRHVGGGWGGRPAGELGEEGVHEADAAPFGDLPPGIAEVSEAEFAALEHGDGRRRPGWLGAGGHGPDAGYAPRPM